jgi:inositol phosphorylceramide synthase catalytic subunit
LSETRAIGDHRLWLRAVTPHALVTVLVLAFAIASDFRLEYLAVTLFWGGLTLAGPRARRFLTLAVPVLCVGILYDKILPRLEPYRLEIHIADLYHAEQRLFGIGTARGVEIPAEWLQRHTSPILDVPCGLAYFAFMYQSFLVAGWLYFVDERRTARFTWAFLICNAIGIVCELLFPTAPPWYVAQYGLGPVRLDAVASAAGAARFDAIFGIHYFASFYARSKDVFGAMPSLHVAYPTLVLLAVWSLRRRWLLIFAAAFTALMAFAAVYLNHHYVLDVIAGLLTAVVAHGLSGLLWPARGTTDAQRH